MPKPPKDPPNDPPQLPVPEQVSIRAKALNIDLDQYLEHLDHLDLPEDQKREMIAALWSVIIGFVDLGFGVSATQTMCGQFGKMAEPAPDQPANMLHSPHSPDPNSSTNAEPEG